MKNFAWRAASNALATEVNKLSRHMKVTGFCRICNREKEDVLHALYMCPHANHLWKAMRERWQLPTDCDLQASSWDWFRTVLMKTPAHLVDHTMLVAWRAWYVRNEITHDKPLPSVEGSRRFLCNYANILGNIRNASTEQVLKGKQLVVTQGTDVGIQRRSEPPDKHWSKPPDGWVKLTIDGSYKMEDGSAGTGMILRDVSGSIIFSACRSLQSCGDALEAELRSCLEGLELASRYSQLPIIVESDCFQLVASVSDKVQDRSSLMHVIAEIKELFSRFSECKIVKVDRGQVRASHCLANWARTESRTSVWLGQILNVFFRSWPPKLL